MIKINNNKIISQNSGFDFVLFLVTLFYCSLKILRITFPESGHSYLKVDMKEIFIILIIIIIIIFWLKHQYLKHKYQSMVQQIIANMLSETVYTGITNLYIITKNQQNTKQYIINVNSVF